MANKSNLFSDRTPTPWHLWVVGILAVLWNAIGAFDYVATQTQIESYMAQFTPQQLEFFYGFPTWLVFFWATAIWSSVAGSFALLLRSRFAYPLFLISLLSMIVTSIHNFGFSNGAEVMGQVGVIFSAIIALICVFLVIYSRAMVTRRVLT